MATATLARRFILRTIASSSLRKGILSPSLSHSKPAIPDPSSSRHLLASQPLQGIRFCSTAETSPAADPQPPRRRNTLVNFSLSDPEEEDSDQEELDKSRAKAIDKSKLPPPYDPFNKKPVIEEPKDPKNLPEVFHNIRSDGLFNNAVKMFDGLSKDGLTHEALELFSHIKDKSEMPEIVAHTAVIEAYCDAGHPREAHKVYQRMLASGVLPNAYTYSVLIKSLAASGDQKLVKEAKKYVMEMVEKRGMKPNAATCVGSFEGLVQMGMEEEGKELLEMLKRKGVVPEEDGVREVVKNKRGPACRTLISILYGK